MHPRFLEVEITGKCPLHCRHCYGRFPKPAELPLEKVCEIIEQSRELFDCIILSGGEPFLHPFITEMVQRAAEDFVVFITTSGHGMSPEHVAAIHNKAVLVFGLDGIEETHDSYRGTGAYKVLLKALDMTRDLPKEIIVTLWKGVLDQIDEIIRLAERYNAIVHFNALIPVGRVRDNPSIMPDTAELEELYGKLSRLKTGGGNVITDLHKVTEKDRREGIDLFCRGRFNITPEGNVRPCEFHYAVLGNIYTQNLQDIITQANDTAMIKAREQGFKDLVRCDLDDPFDYHTQICHKIK